MTLSVVKEQSRAAPGIARPTAAAAKGSTEPLLVLKFGSSVLRRIGDLPAVAGEIYRQRRKGKKVIAVVSALEGDTDRLLKEADEASSGSRCTGTAELVSLGEERSAALLRIACDRIGLPAAICHVEELGLHTEGCELDAEFTSLLPFALLRKLDSCGLVIVPGFVGLGDAGQRTLLGRGGSDLTAVILGAELGAETVRLYKDVDGVFEHDPAVSPSARKFDEITYQDASRVARQLVHSKALELAARQHLTIEVETLGSESPTRIGGRCRLSEAAPAASPLKIALAGYGIVGQALAKRLVGDPRFVIEAILVRDLERNRNVPPPVPLTSDVHAFGAADADVLVELLSCERTGAALSCARLRRGIPVVTASKRMVSEHFLELEANGAAGGADCLFSAAVGGSVPLLEAIDRAVSEGPIEEVVGVLNGTVNFVLQRLHQGATFDAALNEARDKGFAEADCTADLSGADAATKLRLIANRAFGVMPNALEVAAEGLDQPLADTIRGSKERWVQLSRVRRTGHSVEVRVSLCRASEAGLQPGPDEWNAGLIRLANGSELAVRGRGAGGAATAEAVLADLYDLLALKSARKARPPRESCAGRNHAVA